MNEYYQFVVYLQYISVYVTGILSFCTGHGVRGNYFRANLVVASKESKLHSHAQQRRRHLRSIASQKRAYSLTGSTNTSGIFRTSAATVCGDGYLHVTRDRICYIAGPGCARPRLLATWSFDNDDLVQCGTAGVKHVDDLDDSSDTNLVSLFFLTASPKHADAPGGHLFISDRAAELCEWIGANNKGAVCPVELHQLTSPAAARNQPFSSSLPNSSSPIEPFAALSEHRFQTCCQCGLPRELEKANKRNERSSELNAYDAPISDPRLHSCPQCAHGFQQQQSYVNMVPPPRHVGLRPIEEHQTARSAHTQLIGQRFRNDLSKTSLSANVAVSSTMTGSSIFASNTSTALTVQHTYVNLIPSITSSRTTADRGPHVVLTCVHIQPPSCIGTLAVSGQDTPIISSPSQHTTVVSPTASVNDTQHPEVSEPRYVELDLITNPDWRRGSSAGQSSSATVDSTSRLHGVYSTPATIFPDPSGALCHTTEVETSTPEPHYVTIDVIQTKALSEVLHELSLDSTTTNLSPPKLQTNTSCGLFRNRLERDQPNSSRTNTATNEPRTGNQHTNEDASHSAMGTEPHGLPSLSRVGSYLTHHLRPRSTFQPSARPRPATS